MLYIHHYLHYTQECNLTFKTFSQSETFSLVDDKAGTASAF